SAKLQSASLCGEVDLRSPERGLFNLAWRDQALAAHEILGVRLDASEAAGESLCDGYERGGDLIATYEQTAARPLRVQVYWRAADAGAMGTSIDLQLSVQTSLLDSRPALFAATRLPKADVQRLVDIATGKFEILEPTIDKPWTIESHSEPLCWLIRWPQAGLSYIELAMPGETRRSELSLSADCRLTLSHEVFAEPLEKGVILRTRIRGAYLPCDADEQLAMQAWREFISAPPPLTA
ncbi:MAG TPA: hypothetical protein VHB99_15675, partial [Pirellulales bacterium]|nr:hypothetical protein [Pirellulales bacterium]